MNDCISWRLILNCAINDSDKCVKTAIVVIEMRDAPSTFTHPRYDTPERRERRGWLKISNLFHFKVPAPIGIRAKKSRRIYTVTYRTYMGWTSRVTLLPTPIACDTCVLATSGTTHPLPGSRTHPRASLRDTNVRIRGVTKATAPRDSSILRIQLRNAQISSSDWKRDKENFRESFIFCK